MEIKDCLEQGFLARIKPSEDLVGKELNEANYDFDRAEKAFEEEDWKWATIEAYYSIFHAARAVLFKMGLMEKRHFAISVVLDDLSRKGKLESRYVDYFNAALSSREDADYHYIYSEETAKHSLELAEDFLTRMKHLLNGLKELK